MTLEWQAFDDGFTDSGIADLLLNSCETSLGVFSMRLSLSIIKDLDFDSLGRRVRRCCKCL